LSSSFFSFFLRIGPPFGPSGTKAEGFLRSWRPSFRVEKTGFGKPIRPLGVLRRFTRGLFSRNPPEQFGGGGTVSCLRVQRGAWNRYRSISPVRNLPCDYTESLVLAFPAPPVIYQMVPPRKRFLLKSFAHTHFPFFFELERYKRVGKGETPNWARHWLGHKEVLTFFFANFGADSFPDCLAN